MAGRSLRAAGTKRNSPSKREPRPGKWPITTTLVPTLLFPAMLAVASGPLLNVPPGGWHGPHGPVAAPPSDPRGLGASGELPVQTEPGPELLSKVSHPRELASGPAPEVHVPNGPLDIPKPVFDAYVGAADRIREDEPGCGLHWSVLASIGRIESGHARAGRVDVAGTTVSAILGPRLSGAGVAALPDTDSGVWDGDPVWDRAVGPMQFIPETWRQFGADGNGDGEADPHNVNDAALTSGRYLCSGGQDLREPHGLAEAVFRYNHSDAYVREVLVWAEAYARGVLPRPTYVAPEVSSESVLAGSRLPNQRPITSRPLAQRPLPALASPQPSSPAPVPPGLAAPESPHGTATPSESPDSHHGIPGWPSLDGSEPGESAPSSSHHQHLTDQGTGSAPNDPDTAGSDSSSSGSGSERPGSDPLAPVSPTPLLPSDHPGLAESADPESHGELPSYSDLPEFDQPQPYLPHFGETGSESPQPHSSDLGDLPGLDAGDVPGLGGHGSTSPSKPEEPSSGEPSTTHGPDSPATGHSGDHSGADRPSGDQSSSDRPSADHSGSDQSSADGPSADQPSADGPSADHPATEPPQHPSLCDPQQLAEFVAGRHAHSAARPSEVHPGDLVRAESVTGRALQACEVPPGFRTEPLPSSASPSASERTAPMPESPEPPSAPRSSTPR